MKKFYTLLGIICFGILMYCIQNTVSAAGVVEIPFNGNDINLYTFPDDGTGTGMRDEGVKEINDALMAIVNWFRIILGSLATVWIVWQGYRMLSSGGDETQFSSAQNNIIWGSIALIVSFLVDPIIRGVLYGGAGGLTPGGAILDPELSTAIGRAELKGFMDWIKTMLGIVAVGMIIFTGIRAMLSLGSEDEMTKQKTNVRWVMIGIIIIIFNEIIVNFGIYGDPHLEGNKPVVVRDILTVIREMAGFINFYITFAAMAAVGAMVYGGYLILTAQFNEEQAEQGKNIIKFIVMGIVMILISYVLVRTVIFLQS